MEEMLCECCQSWGLESWQFERLNVFFPVDHAISV